MGIYRNDEQKAAGNKEPTLIDRELSRHFLHLLDLTPDIVVVIDRAGYIIRCSSALPKMLGFSKEELSEKALLDLVHPEDREDTLKTFADQFSTGRSVCGYRNRYSCKGGIFRWIEWTAVTVPEEDVGYAIGRDVTEQKQLEDEVKFQRDLLHNLGRCTTLGAALTMVLRSLFNLREFDSGAIYVVDEESGGLHLNIHEGLSRQFVESFRYVKASDPRAQLVREGKMQCITKEDILLNTESTPSGEGITAFAILPILNEGKPIACINVATHTHDEISEHSRMVLESTAGLVAPLLDSRRQRDKVARSEKMLTEIVNNADSTITVKNTQGEYLLVDNDFCRYVDKDRESILGKTASELVGGEESVVAQDADARVMETGGPVTIVGEFETRIGTRNFRVNKFPLFDPNESIYAIGSVVTDVSELEASRKELLAATTRFELAESAAAIGSWEWDIISDELHWSKNIESLFGLEPGTFGRSYEAFIDIVHPEDRSSVQAKVTAAVENAREYDIEHRIRWPDGTVRWMSERGAVVRNTEGTAISMYGIVHDVTDRQLARHELVANQRLLQQIINNSSSAIYAKDLDGRYTLVNTEFVKLLERQLGSKKESFLGKNDYELFPVQVAEQFRNNDKEALSRGAPFLIEERSQVDGATLYYLSNKFPLVNQSGVATGTCGISTDITAQKNATIALGKYSSRLETEVAGRTADLKEVQRQLLLKERLAVIGELGGKVSHEMRNPLTAIKNALYLLRMKLHDADDKSLKYLAIAETQTQRTIDITAELLDFSRNAPLDLRLANLNELIEKILPEHAIPENITIKTDLSHDFPQFLIDENTIRRIVNNLVSNAVAAMADGGKLAIYSSRRKDNVEIQVTDTGCGIPDDTLQHLFEPLFTTKPTGIGLGLPIVKESVERLGGEISVVSEVGVGTTFRIRFPLRRQRE